VPRDGDRCIADNAVIIQGIIAGIRRVRTSLKLKKPSYTANLSDATGGVAAEKSCTPECQYEAGKSRVEMQLDRIV
jgi:hypothetical protein